ncbi:MAG TPA: methylated-DNA--[protein]-cysteine S-methyltransferase [Polyangiales bacterium]
MAKGDVHALAPVSDARLGCGALPVPAVDATLWLAWTATGLSNVSWVLGADQPQPADVPAHLPVAPIPQIYEQPLRDYFAGKPLDPAQLPVDLHGTDFQCRVWQALRRIARGSVRSYVGVATDVGAPRGMRAVGMANAKNPLALVVPCHRVIEKDMGLGGYTPGLHIKRYLLALEGVRVDNERVQPGQLTLI